MTDEGDDDPQLRSLRVVWLALPDEEPPTRGLDALMAAAHAKAKQMTVPAHESLWRRMLDTLLRPPVLALATVVVLIGGAVLISQRDSIKNDAQPKLERAREPELAPAIGNPQSKQPVVAQPPVVETKPPVDEPESRVPEGHTAPATKPGTPPPRHMGAQKLQPSGIVEPKKPAGGEQGFTTEVPKIKAKLDEKQVETGAEESLAGDDTAKADSKAATTRGPRQVMVDELLEQSRSAATRGDCENSRLIANRIAKQNMTFYRERVTTDAAIKKCIAATATTLDAQ